jgi:hypothetical protein
MSFIDANAPLKKPSNFRIFVYATGRLSQVLSSNKPPKVLSHLISLNQLLEMP